MSLSEFARLSNKNLQLYKQLNDSAYKAINGKRQEVRNFREGVVDIGKIHFEQPKDVLTKRDEERKKSKNIIETEEGKINLEKARIQLDDIKAMDDSNSDISKAYRDTIKSRFNMIGKNINIPE